jgi:hypothetical protein
MMTTYVRVGAALMALLLQPGNAAQGAEPIKSGLQAGEHITTIFEPLNLNGPHANEPHCLVCENGQSPVAMILARDASESLLRLIAKLDAACVRHARQELGSFVVFFDASEPLQEKLRGFAAKAMLKKLVLASEAEKQIPEYKASAEADVTVLLYSRHQVKANFAFRKGELSDAAIDAIVDALPKILNEK